MENNGPLGFFDSGVGGTSIWKEVIQLLPYENSIYLADSRNAPYGEKPVKEIIALCKKNTDRLLEMGCKIIVVACNTATTNAIDYLRSNYHVPFIGIEPAIKPAALSSKTKFIGILATKGTLSSALFSKTSELYKENITIVEVVGQGLVDLIEQGAHESPEMELHLRTLLKPMLIAQIDYLVLGCSHYPYLLPVLRKIFPPGVTIIDSGEAVARQTRKVLAENNLLHEAGAIGKHTLFSNSDPAILSHLVNAKQNGYTVSYLEF
ncbi:glutamate racemase [Antarcticibacterium flavum]|uniref:Glutamate racemase n=1 Tax=Antarcticibacterium flavum TaxID=2058175 RepID=A0A5B7X696_9FLAO|nr:MULTISPECIES: glutamate racemase [Antarcticibacterium]MCM4158382.1 glutamate racemase [Antarcticibacterium sp. W02-3]QCY70143.1 glutamate racemase [Antarcticibacterium flavum]